MCDYRTITPASFENAECFKAWTVIQDGYYAKLQESARYVTCRIWRDAYGTKEYRVARSKFSWNSLVKHYLQDEVLKNITR